MRNCDIASKTIVAFDFDGTITKKDTLIEFIKFSKGLTKLCLCFLIFTPLLIAMKLRLMPNEKVKQLVFQFLYKGISIDTFNQWCDEFCSVVDRIVYEKAVETIKTHQNSGAEVIIVTASFENWVRPWAEKQGIKTVIGTAFEVNKDGQITGKFTTKNCYGKEKVNRMLEFYPNRNEYKLIAYGDSRGDKELLNIADEKHYRKFNR